MTNRVHKSSDGKYHISGHIYDLLVGSRAQVMHGTAYKTTGGLKKTDMTYNKQGKIVSSKKSATAKKEKRLEHAGYKPTKGKFVIMRKSMAKKSAKKAKSLTRSKSKKGKTMRKTKTV